MESDIPASLNAIDVHAHYVDPISLEEMHRAFPDHAPRFEESQDGNFLHFPAGFSQRFEGGVVRRLPAGLLDLDVRISAMHEQDRVQMQALSGYSWLNFTTLPGEVAAALHRIHNDGMIRDARTHPDRFLAMPSLPMQDAPLAVAEIERLAQHPEVCGVGIGSNVNGMNLDDPALEPIWEALDAHDLPVLVHPPGFVAGEDRLDSYHLINLIGNPVDTTIAVARVVCSGLLERYQKLRFCFVHGGGFAPYQLGRWDHGWEVRTETKSQISRPPSEYFDRCYFDSLTHDAASLRFLGEKVGWDHVMLGTDYPWDMATETPISDLLEAGLSSEALPMVARKSAEGFLRWPR